MGSIIGVTAAVAGKDPLDPRSWSGSSARLFGELARRGRLAQAIGVGAPPLTKAWLAVRTVRADRARWRERLALEPGFREALTRALARRLDGEDGDLLQIGAYLDGPRARAGRGRAFSYHDGALCVRLASPFPLVGVPAKTIERALAYERDLAQRMDRVFTMSAHLRRAMIERYGLPENRIVVIGAGVNLDAAPPPPPDKRYDKAELVFVGADFVRKGGPELLQAFAAVRRRFPAALLHVAGPRRLDPAPGVISHGYADKATLSTLFQRATLFVMPSRYEPFGLAPVEAMAHGLAAVVTDQGALAETVEAGVTGAHVRVQDATHLEETLIALLEDPQALALMGQAARRAALTRHTWPAVADRLEAALPP